MHSDTDYFLLEIDQICHCEEIIIFHSTSFYGSSCDITCFPVSNRKKRLLKPGKWTEQINQGRSESGIMFFLSSCGC